jgi:hypothetical protein
MSEQLKRRLDRVESAEMVTADDARRERIDIKMQAHLSGIMQAHERGEDYLTDDDEIKWIEAQYKKIAHLLPQIYIPGVQNGAFKNRSED